MSHSQSAGESGAKSPPLSPHLQVYKPQLTSGMSIFHRITGVALVFGLLLVTYWLGAAATGLDVYATAQDLIGSILGQAVLFGFSLALYYHLLNGIRHLFWDFGYGLELKTAYASGYGVLIATGVLTILTWIVAYALR